jgi:hypothetical protein
MICNAQLVPATAPAGEPGPLACGNESRQCSNRLGERFLETGTGSLQRFHTERLMSQTCPLLSLTELQGFDFILDFGKPWPFNRVLRRKERRRAVAAPR